MGVGWLAMKTFFAVIYSSQTRLLKYVTTSEQTTSGIYTPRGDVVAYPNKADLLTSFFSPAFLLWGTALSSPNTCCAVMQDLQVEQDGISQDLGSLAVSRESGGGGEWCQTTNDRSKPLSLPTSTRLIISLATVQLSNRHIIKHVWQKCRITYHNITDQFLYIEMENTQNISPNYCTAAFL